MKLKEVAINSIALGDHGDRAPEWVELVPAGVVVGRDGRGWNNTNPGSIIEHFHSLGRDLPIDIEHATEHKAPQGEPAPAVGWVDELDDRDGAVWGHVQWNSQGEELVAGRAYRYLSPVILYTPKDGTIVGLTSVGLTNQPNLYLSALNQQEGKAPEEESMYKALLAALGLSETASEAEAVARVKELNDNLSTALNRVHNPDLEKFVPREDYNAAVAKANNAQADLDAMKMQQLDETIEAAIEGALKDGKITPATREYHTAQCRQEGGLERFQDFVKNAPVIGGDSGLDTKKPGGEQKALNAEDQRVCAMLGIDQADYQKTTA